MNAKRTFAGIPAEFDEASSAKVVLIPVPYDGTSTWGKGSDLGPEAFIEASENMELYDIETDSEVYREGVHLAPAITEDSSPEAMCAAVQKEVGHWIDQGKLVSLFGGEHSISIGSIAAFQERFEDLTVLQIDAHADLRPSYGGTACNHACAMHAASKRGNLLQVGIRSMDISEKEHMDMSKVWFSHEIDREENHLWVTEVLDNCTEKVYLTIDLDAFDPSVLPSTGTPEPGGLSWQQMLFLVRALVKRKQLVGFDIVELCPNEAERSSDFVAAKLYYKILSYHFYKRSLN